MADRIILEEKANKIVYREGHTIVKEFTPSHPKANVFNEAYIHACVEGCGVPSPKIISVGPADGGWALSGSSADADMTAMVLTISKSPLHQTIIHPREEVSTQTFIPEQFIYGRSL